MWFSSALQVMQSRETGTSWVVEGFEARAQPVVRLALEKLLYHVRVAWL